MFCWIICVGAKMPILCCYQCSMNETFMETDAFGIEKKCLQAGEESEILMTWSGWIPKARLNQVAESSQNGQWCCRGKRLQWPLPIPALRSKYENPCLQKLFRLSNCNHFADGVNTFVTKACMRPAPRHIETQRQAKSHLVVFGMCSQSNRLHAGFLYFKPSLHKKKLSIKKKWCFQDLQEFRILKRIAFQALFPLRFQFLHKHEDLAHAGAAFALPWSDPA